MVAKTIKWLRLLIVATLVWGASYNLPALAQLTKPRLVVVIVADQFCYDYMARYQDRFSSHGGFRFLLEHAANFSDCVFKQNTTQTAVGHAVISTGSYPWSNGIIANDWYDRRKGKEISAVSDDNLQLVGATGAACGTRALIGTTFGDELKLDTNGRSKVVTVSLKDRAALFLAGRLANGAYWWDHKSGNFVTSSQYLSDPPGWVQSFNNMHWANQFFGKSWEKLLPESQYIDSTRDDYPYERAIPGDGRLFPHVITGGASTPGEAYYGAFVLTPWANQMVADFAKQAIDGEAMGLHNEPDFLGVSFSSGDYLGHAFGPYSQEMEDMVLRLDNTLGDFFQYLDTKVGLNKCLIVFTADHGVVPIPEFLKEHGIDSGRIDPKLFVHVLNTELSSRLGQAEWIESFTPPNLYLNLNEIDKHKYRQPDVEALTAKIARSVIGVGDVYTAVQFFMNQLPSGPYADAVRRSYYGPRSGELIILTKPDYIFSSEPNGTTHGSPYSYDAHVPLFMFGTNIRRGTYGNESSPADIAPTISSMLGIQFPATCEGRVLQEAMEQVSGPPSPYNLSAKPINSQTNSQIAGNK